MLDDLMNAAEKELNTLVEGQEYTSKEAENLILKIAKKQVPSDPTKALMIVADDYRLLTYEPLRVEQLREEKELTPILVIQYLIQEAIEDGLWEIIECYIVDDGAGGP